MMMALLLGIILLIGTPISLDGTPPATTPGTIPQATPISASDPIYLAMGNSLAYGTGASDPDTSGYVPLVHDFLRSEIPCQLGEVDGCAEVQLVNIAQEGATTTWLLENQLPTARELIETRNSDTDPGNDVTVITIDIGGNDAYRVLSEVCAAGLSAACGQAIDETFTTIGQNLTQALTQLRTEAGPDTEIVVMTYFNSLIACEQRAAADTADLVLEGGPDGMPGLNDIIREAAARVDASVAETFGLLGEEDLVGGEDCVHPDTSGHVKIAAAFEQALLG